MRWYYHDKYCEYCDEEFQSSRFDARFCSAKCRAASSRRQKRREKASQGMKAEWSIATNNAYNDLIEFSPRAADSIKDIFVEHGAEAATKATMIAFEAAMDVIHKMEAHLELKEQTIERLRVSDEVLQSVKRLVM